MFEALVITLREGVEAALVLAIAIALLRRRALERHIGVLLGGAATALLASAAVAAGASRIRWNEELAEGIAMLVGAGLVLTLVVWMWRSAPRMREEIESGLDRASAAGGSAAGIFLLGFGMVFREGVETAVFLSAAGFTSRGLGLWVGALLGLLIAVGFGVLFVRGSIRVPLKAFFSLTSAVLVLLAAQLLVGGLHELSEAEVLPSSRAEMALIGPVVKNELLLFTLTVALAAGWLLFGPSWKAASATRATEGPEARLARAARARETSRRRWTGILGLVVVAVLTTAFVRETRLPERAPAQEVPLVDGAAHIDAAVLADGALHFYETKLGETPVRFFAIRSGNEIHTCADACEICGDKGYFQDGPSLVCRNCTSPIVVSSLGRGGGCNPIPLTHRAEGGSLVLTEADLRSVVPHLKGR